MTHVEILKAARRVIKASMKEDGKFLHLFICLAIDGVTGHADYDKGQQLIRWIGEMIHPHNYLHNWLSYQMDIDVFDAPLLNAYRLLWLDKLIQEYEQ